ncbi:MAG: hypothetical protein E7652_07515 [Ruminococcaceae bacterium]|nr:hypothetical protein [Oscillospiraceae bacterium]
MLKKTKLFIGIAFLVQAVTFLTIFIVLWAKKKSISKTFLVIGLLGGVTGTVLTVKALKEDKQFKAMLAAVEGIYDFDENDAADEIEVLIDDTAKEADFE